MMQQLTLSEYETTVLCLLVFYHSAYKARAGNNVSKEKYHVSIKTYIKFVVLFELLFDIGKSKVFGQWLVRFQFRVLVTDSNILKIMIVLY